MTTQEKSAIETMLHVHNNVRIDLQDYFDGFAYPEAYHSLPEEYLFAAATLVDLGDAYGRIERLTAKGICPEAYHDDMQERIVFKAVRKTLSYIARKCGAKNPLITVATKTGKPRTKSAAMWACDIAEGKEKIEGLSY